MPRQPIHCTLLHGVLARNTLQYRTEGLTFGRPHVQSSPSKLPVLPAERPSLSKQQLVGTTLKLPHGWNQTGICVGYHCPRDSEEADGVAEKLNPAAEPRCPNERKDQDNPHEAEWQKKKAERARHKNPKNKSRDKLDRNNDPRQPGYDEIQNPICRHMFLLMKSPIIWMPELTESMSVAQRHA